MSLHRRLIARLTTVVIVCFIAVLLVGCGSDAPADQSSAADGGDGTPSAGGTGGDFCAAFAELSPHFGVIETGMTDDAAATAESVAAARALLESAEPPSDLGPAWADITAFYVTVDDAFAEVDVTSGAATASVLGDAALEIPETVGPATEGITVVENHAATECSGDAGPASSAAATEASDLCAVLSGDDLARVFGDDIPEPQDGSFGPEARECIWESEDGTAVSVMVLTRKDFDSELRAKSGPPRAEVDELENGQLHTGTFGIGRFSTQGSSVYFTAGDWGGTANVRTGEDGDAGADDPVAIDFATIVAGAVG